MTASLQQKEPEMPEELLKRERPVKEYGELTLKNMPGCTLYCTSSLRVKTLSTL
jgi:hypothetical protein